MGMCRDLGDLTHFLYSVCVRELNVQSLVSSFIVALNGGWGLILPFRGHLVMSEDVCCSSSATY